MATNSSYLDRSLLPMRLWRKAQVHGRWDPATLDFESDRRDWLTLSTERQTCVRQLCALFHFGEAAVTKNLLPLISVVASQGRKEEEIYLSSFLSDEAKHVDFFDLWFRRVVEREVELDRFGIHPILEQELAEDLQRLWSDGSIEAQVRAAVTYHLVVEGVMAETGYNVFSRMLGHLGALPGLRRGMEHLRRDESRHIAYGVYVLRRLLLEGGTRAYAQLINRVGELKPLVEQETHHLASYGADNLGISIDDLRRLTRQRFAARIQRVVGLSVGRNRASGGMGQ